MMHCTMDDVLALAAGEGSAWARQHVMMTFLLAPLVLHVPAHFALRRYAAFVPR